MCSVDSSNAPEFFLHHGYIDELWARWQNKGPAYKNLAFYKDNTTPMPAANEASPRDVYDLDNQPGCVRVCNEPSSQPCRLSTTYTPVCPREINYYEYSPIKLSNLIPRPFPSMLPEAVELFNTSVEITNIAHRLTELFGNVAELYEAIQSNVYSSCPC